MKRLLVVFLGLLVVLSVNLSAFAAEAGEGESTSQEVITVTDTVVPDVTVINEIVQADETEGILYSVETYGDYSLASTYAVTADDATGLKALILSLIGDYEGIVVEYAYENSSGYTSYVREIQLDYPWLCTCAIFLVVLYCVFRLGGAILCKK